MLNESLLDKLLSEITPEKQAEVEKRMEEKTVEDSLKIGSIVWFKDSNGVTNNGKVKDIISNSKCAFVFNFERWADCMVEFHNISRVDINYFKEEYL